ncbi:MAG: NAD-dependent epimerase/dehydratase family protein [Isosphaeraceae bacterium]|nr:NAD-dependent epimerase/dehydratase family protein [Isosphaeraceae bacterium]
MDHVLAHTAGIWEAVRGERLFVTGGTGFFGGWMIETLLHVDARLRLGVQAHLLTRNAARYRATVPHVAGHPSITLSEGDVRDFTFPNADFSIVLHMATETELGGSAAASFTTAVAGTTRVLEFAARCAAQKLLLTSSGAVYGTQPPDIERIDEGYVGAPRPEDQAAGYGHGKRAAEFLCTAAAADTGLEVKIARCFAFVGPLLPLDANFAVGNFISDALKGSPIRVNGDGTPRRSYLYAADLAVWLWTILIRGASVRPYNVGSEADTSIRDLAALVAAVVRPNTEVLVAPASTGRGLPARYVPSTGRAASELGLQPIVGLADAVRRTAEWQSGLRAPGFPEGASTVTTEGPA